MAYPQPPFPQGNQPPATTPSPATPTAAYPPYPPWQYAYPRPMGTENAMLTAGAVLSALGGLLIGIGWLLPTENYYIVIGIGWLLFGPGVGLSLLGLGRRGGRW